MADPAVLAAALVDGLGPAALRRAASYTAGGNWLLVLGVPVTFVAAFLLVRSHILARLSARIGARHPGRAAFVVAGAAILGMAILLLPWNIWTGYLRERAYGRTAQPFSDWLLQGGLSAVLTAIIGALFFMLLFFLMRRVRRWWLAAGWLVACATAVLLLLGPALIEPMFNHYRLLPPGPVQVAVAGLARDAGIAENRIFVFDGSRQSNNFTANVSGILQSARIALSDVALSSASVAEVKAVVAHETGHYVLHHIWWTVLLYAALSVLFFFLYQRCHPFLARMFRSDSAITDPASIPLLLFFLSAFLLLAQPAIFALSRGEEAAADRYSLQYAREPDALAAALLKTAVYRDPRPPRWEEWLFYSHPAVERRIRVALAWKAAHAGPRQGKDGAASFRGH